MNRPFLLPPLSGEDLLELQRLIRAPSTAAGLYRRCLLIWQLAAGYSIRDAAQIASLHYTNAHKWVKRFQSDGLASLRERKRPGRPRIHGGEIEDVVIKTATSGTLKSKEVLSCIRRLASEWKFPAPTEGSCAVVQVPFQFSPKN